MDGGKRRKTLEKGLECKLSWGDHVAHRLKNLEKKMLLGKGGKTSLKEREKKKKRKKPTERKKSSWGGGVNEQQKGGTQSNEDIWERTRNFLDYIRQR